VITGIIVAAKGMLSTNADAKAEIQRIIVIATIMFPFDTSPICPARVERTPVSSSPLTVTNSPRKKSKLMRPVVVGVEIKVARFGERGYEVGGFNVNLEILVMKIILQIF